MATTSVLGAAEDYIVAAIKADSRIIGPPAVTVSEGRLPVQKREEVFFYDAQLVHELPVMKGSARIPRQETGTILFAINAATPGQMGKVARDRALVLLAVIEDVLANDVTLGYTVSWCRIAAPISVGIDASGEGWDGLIRGVIEYDARLN